MKVILPILFACVALFASALARAQPLPTGDEIVVEAREALRKKDKPRLAALRDAAIAAHHPLVAWVEYWELGNRLDQAQADEVEAFYTRWSGTYVEDRLRNDWLLELGRRRDWATFARDMPRFKMNDDREVTCYALLTRHLAGQDVHAAALDAWMAQRELDDGCNLLATTLHDAGQLGADEIWAMLRQAAEFNRARLARAAGELIGPSTGRAVGQLFENPAQFLARKPGSQELVLLALMRLAAADPEAAAEQLEKHWRRRLPPVRLALAWASIGKQAALKHQPEALDDYRRAWKVLGDATEPGWSNDMLAWQVRAALRAAPDEPGRWPLVVRAIETMGGEQQSLPVWVYWKAHAVQQQAPAGAAGEADRAAAKLMLESIAGQMSFYGKLATEELGGRVVLPAAPAPLTPAEKQAVRATPGFARALQLIDLGLRSEGVREWNFTLRGLGDRDLLAAAQWACEREVWDRCISTSERTRGEVDVAQRFPTPFRSEVLARAREIGIDPAYIYGLIRQESRFVMDARSGAGASGLMQLMPGTARWTARKIGFEYRPEMLGDRDVNLRLGASYLKLVLDAFGGSQPLAAAAYNAGPRRSRRWRDGGNIEPAAWAESIPFNETRDYVKKVLSNSVDYAELLGGKTASLKERLGAMIGPATTANERDIP